MIMATQGYKMDNSKSTLNEANTLYTTRNGVQAFGVYDGEKFEVLEGSEIDMTSKCHSDNIEKQRQTAIKNGNIVDIGGKYKLNVSVSLHPPALLPCLFLAVAQMAGLNGRPRTEKHWTNCSANNNMCIFIRITEGKKWIAP